MVQEKDANRLPIAHLIKHHAILGADLGRTLNVRSQVRDEGKTPARIREVCIDEEEIIGLRRYKKKLAQLLMNNK